MTNSVRLVIITGEYPFGTEETFLETEIKYLAERYADVLILPSKIDSKKRVLPVGVKTDTTFAVPFCQQRRKIRSIFSVLFLKGLIYHYKLIYSFTAIRRINSFVSDSLITLGWLQRNFTENTNTILYTYWFNGKTFGALLFSEQRTNVKVVSRAHRYDLYDYWFRPSFWPFRQKMLDLINKLYVVSQDGLDYLTSKYKIQSCELSRLGVEDQGFITTFSKDNALRIVSVSGLRKTKRVDLIAKLMIQYCSTNIDQVIIWKHFGDGPEMEHIQGVLKSNAPLNLKYELLGQQSNKKIIEFYRDNPVDIFINLSISEGIPVSIMEAISCGIPCIATNVGGSSEIVNETTGKLVSGNPNLLSIIGFLSELDCNKNLFDRTIVKQFWRENFDAKVNYGQFADSLAKLIDES